MCACVCVSLVCLIRVTYELCAVTSSIAELDAHKRCSLAWLECVLNLSVFCFFSLLCACYVVPILIRLSMFCLTNVVTKILLIQHTCIAIYSKVSVHVVLHVWTKRGCIFDNFSPCMKQGNCFCGCFNFCCFYLFITICFRRGILNSVLFARIL